MFAHLHFTANPIHIPHRDHLARLFFLYILHDDLFTMVHISSRFFQLEEELQKLNFVDLRQDHCIRSWNSEINCHLITQPLSWLTE